MHLVPFIYSPNDHHSDKNLQIADVTGIAREKRLYSKRPIGLHHYVYPGSGNIDTWQFVHDLIYLHDDDSIVKSCGFDNDGRVFGIWTSEKVAFCIGLLSAHQRHVGHEIHQQPGIQLNVGVYGADLELAVLQQLRYAQALRTGKREIYFLGYA